MGSLHAGSSGNAADTQTREPIYEGETWVNEGCAIKIVCRISVFADKPFALQWTKNNQPLNLSRVAVHPFMSFFFDKMEVY